jgi:hypothetical protein
VRVHKAKTPPKSIRYLLYADRRLPKISLRRMSVPVRKAKKAARSIRLKNPARATNSMRLPWAISPWAIVAGMTCLMTAAALVAARQPSHTADVASVHAQPDATTPRETLTLPVRVKTNKAVVPEASTTAVVAKTYSADASREKAPAMESTLKAATVEPTSKPEVQSLAPVTITGCLELDQETFWLKNTSGVAAPKSRGWRSGFLKKGPSPVELVDATNTLKLPNYIGQRVTASGVLTNRALRARSLQRVAASCG